METWIIILIVFIIILVIAGAGFAIYWFFIRNTKTTTTRTTGGQSGGSNGSGGSGGNTDPNRGSQLVYGDKIRLFNISAARYLSQCGNITTNACSRNVNALTPVQVNSTGISLAEWTVQSRTKNTGDNVMTGDTIELVSVSNNTKLKICQDNDGNLPASGGLNVGSSASPSDTSNSAQWALITTLVQSGQNPPAPVGVTSGSDFIIRNASINQANALNIAFDMLSDCGFGVIDTFMSSNTRWQVQKQ